MFLDIVEKALLGLLDTARPGAYLVDFLPILKYVPSWVPGTGRQRQAVEWRQATEDMVELPYRKALDLIAAGTLSPRIPHVYSMAWTQR
ncbi:hypothetical protein FIBSPDRAFT_312511 [Athelia psychrophila]|uniref:Uncharacterized protein n=1 Tax=Athelia psychrophila TaxID=1759441 RepID=A0A166WDR2_9AGAM|nr:hypothetical protein FIBSPDRAFT_312511 [Fibularhizoctonia sp. CBS 109695]